MAAPSKPNLDELAASIVRCFPSLNLIEQRLSLDLYRMLAEGAARSTHGASEAARDFP
jgi:hypothetical protein